MPFQMPQPFEITVYTMVQGQRTAETVSAYPTASPHLAVHRSMLEFNSPIPVYEAWTITHIPSGTTVIDTAPSYALALTFANKLAQSKRVDWSKDMPAQKAPRSVLNAQRDFASILAQIGKIYVALGGEVRQ